MTMKATKLLKQPNPVRSNRARPVDIKFWPPQGKDKAWDQRGNLYELANGGAKYVGSFNGVKQ